MTEEAKDTLPVEGLLINSCCGAGFNLVVDWNKANPGKNLKVKKVGIFRARDMGLDKKYGFDIKELSGTSHGILVIGDKIVSKC